MTIHCMNFRFPSPRLVRVLAFAALAVAFVGCATTKSRPMAKPRTALRTVQYVDVARYMGDWRVIANIPYSAQKNCVDSIESYALRPDGTIENWFTYRKKSFDAPQKTIKAQAEVVNKQTNAEWRVKFSSLTKAPYFIIDLDPNYQWTVVGHPSRDYGWIMARDRVLPPAILEAILDRLAVQGYDPARFAKVPQLPGAPPAAF